MTIQHYLKIIIIKNHRRSMEKDLYHLSLNN